MMRYRWILFGFIAIMLLPGCSKKLTPFTKSLYQTNNWSEGDLKRIQFYLSNDIVLRRQVVDASSEIISGEIKMVDGRQVEEIIIPKKTPGVLTLLRDEKDHFGISFEDGRFLMFGPNPKQGGEYVLLASDWKNRVGKVRYDEKTYYTTPGDGFAALLVNLKKIQKEDIKRRKVSGVKVN